MNLPSKSEGHTNVTMIIVLSVLHLLVDSVYSTVETYFI